jgi:hypothetical protein
VIKLITKMPSPCGVSVRGYCEELISHSYLEYHAFRIRFGNDDAFSVERRRFPSRTLGQFEGPDGVLELTLTTNNAPIIRDPHDGTIMSN